MYFQLVFIVQQALNRHKTERSLSRLPTQTSLITHSYEKRNIIYTGNFICSCQTRSNRLWTGCIESNGAVSDYPECALWCTLKTSWYRSHCRHRFSAVLLYGHCDWSILTRSWSFVLFWPSHLLPCPVYARSDDDHQLTVTYIDNQKNRKRSRTSGKRPPTAAPLLPLPLLQFKLKSKFGWITGQSPIGPSSFSVIRTTANECE